MIGLITLGTSPRLDLLSYFEEHCRGDKFILVGALDGLSNDSIKNLTVHEGKYPLSVRIGTQSEVIDIEVLKPFIEKQINHLHELGCKRAVLLCSGEFDFFFKSQIPIIRPSFLLEGTVKANQNNKNILVVSPIKEQIAANEKKWRSYGFNPIVIAIPPTDFSCKQIKNALPNDYVSQIVLDCISYTREHRLLVEKQTNWNTWTPIELVGAILNLY
ncbi:AroM family protein [Lysinibacillus telephonicus]|uniref:AroM family protein n=1 Tax=Lysinibacillus telephonicus TaxID=1714840 RepID=A0A3S0JR25_9BACI|nr:AroM family protein [Lysinibacillus telephonicus]RTQ94327.1 hypothetical protein EKG35_06100 [Lysinibacillus telephonicus]